MDYRRFRLKLEKKQLIISLDYGHLAEFAVLIRNQPLLDSQSAKFSLSYIHAKSLVWTDNFLALPICSIEISSVTQQIRSNDEYSYQMFIHSIGVLSNQLRDIGYQDNARSH
jgi:hypothetical protein